MKTICPHCCQGYNIAEEHLQQELICEDCERNFVALKAKFCSECGTLNHAASATCRKCGCRMMQPQAGTAPVPEG